MSRKSKRRKQRQPENGPPVQAVADGFEFLDDRGAPMGEADFVPAEQVAAAKAVATESAPAAVAEPAAVEASTRGRAKRGRGGSESAAVGASGQSESETVAETVTAAGAQIPAPAAPAPVSTLGEILTTARQARGLSIEEASARTRIATKMIQHLENDCFSEFAAEAYVRGFLRSYGNLLGLDAAMLLSRYEALVGHRAEPIAAEWTPDVEPARTQPPAARSSRKNGVAGVAVGAVALLTGIGVVLSQRGTLELRPTAGLNQIENELRQSQPNPAEAPASAPMAAPALEQPTVVEPTALGPQANGINPVAAPGGALATNLAAPAREDTSPPASTTRFASHDPGTLTDLVEEPAPGVTKPIGPTIAGLPAAAPDGALVLTATARDSCSLRLQIDADARHAQRYLFTQAGETRAWTAKSSFRILARQAAQLELRLNGRLVPVPAEGRTVVLDRSTLDGKTAVPVRSRRGSRRVRKSTRSPAAAPANNTANPTPQNAAGPP